MNPKARGMVKNWKNIHILMTPVLVRRRRFVMKPPAKVPPPPMGTAIRPTRTDASEAVKPYCA